jgi:hypothetical protein
MANKIKLAGTTVPSFKVGLQGATISSESVTTPYSLVLPPELGTSGQVLVLDSSGNLAFIDSAPVAVANGNASMSVLADGTIVLPDTGSFQSPSMVLGESSVQMGSNLPNLRQTKEYIGMTAGQNTRIVALSSVTQTGGFVSGAIVTGVNLPEENTVVNVQTIGTVNYFTFDFEPSVIPQIGDELTFTLAALDQVSTIFVGVDGYQDSFTPPRLYIELDFNIQIGDVFLDGYPYPYETVITNIVQDEVDFPGQMYIETDLPPDTIPTTGEYLAVYRNTLNVDTGTVGSPAANHLPYYNANGVVPDTGAKLNGPNVTDEPVVSNWVALIDGGGRAGVIAVTPSISIADAETYTAVYINSQISSSVIIGDSMLTSAVTGINRSVFIGSNISGNSSNYDNSVSIGYLGIPGQNSVSLGGGANSFGTYGVAIGANSTATGSSGVAVGVSSFANTSAVALGQSSRANVALSVALGYAATATASQSLALGAFSTASGANGIAFGRQCVASAADSIRMGFRTGIASPNAVRSIAIGLQSGEYTQGANAIAIGAFAGSSGQANNSIVLNATGAALTNTTANAFVVKPIRNVTGNAQFTVALYYNPTTGEIGYM